jgi:hypothetical protein
MTEHSTYATGDGSEQPTETTGAGDREAVAIGGPETERERALPLDQTFEILKNRRRRCVLRYLYEADGPVSLSDLAEQIAAWENDKEIRQITSSERKRVYVGLYQCHLPKMDGMDVVSFNKPRGMIEQGENADCFEPYLRQDDPDSEPSPARYHAGLAILGISLLPLVAFLQTETLVPLVVAVLFVAILTLGTAAHLARKGGDTGSRTPP